MKNIILILLLILPVFILAENALTDEVNALSVTMSLEETAFQLDMPVKQLKMFLKLDPETDSEISLQDLHISKKAVNSALAEYSNSKHSFFTGIVIVGMLIVFASLLIIGFIIDRMKSLKNLDKKKKASLPVRAKITAVNGVKPSSNDIIAAITTVYLHELEAEEQSKLMLTWKRASLSLWNASAKINMPNRVFFKN